MKTKLLALFVATFMYAIANAQFLNQPTVFYDYDIPYNTSPLPIGTQFIDRWGYPFNSSANTTESILPDSTGVGTYTCGKFKLVFADQVLKTKYGFDDTTHIKLPITHQLGTSTSIGALRRWTLCQVLDYVGHVIKIPNNVMPDIYIGQSINDSNSSKIAFASPSYAASVNTPSFLGGALHYHITNATGIDPTPGANDFDAKITYNFYWKFNNDAAAINNIGFDLFMITLHEITHALGFLSIINSNGKSGQSYTSPGVYSLFDANIVTKKDTNVIRKDSFSFNTKGGVKDSDLISNSLKYYLPTNTKKFSIYSPYPWLPGSSLSHFDGVRDNENYLMNYTPLGISREWHKAELEVLCNLGYILDSAYTKFVCGDRYAIGLDDTAYTSTNTTVTVNVINGNGSGIGKDFDPDGDAIALDISSISLLSGLGSISANGNSITFTPTNGYCGYAVIKYRPYTIKNGFSGSYANLTIYISCPSYCPKDPCNLVCNGSFEEDVSLAQFDAICVNNAFYNVSNNAAPHWFDYRCGTADSYFRGSTDSVPVVLNSSIYVPAMGVPVHLAAPTLPGIETYNNNTTNKRYAGFLSYLPNIPYFTPEGIYCKLAQRLEIGNTYKLNLKARATSSCSLIDTVYLLTNFLKSNKKLKSDTSNNCYEVYTDSNQIKNIVKISNSHDSAVWTDIVKTFVATDTSNYLLFQSTNVKNCVTSFTTSDGERHYVDSSYPYMYIDNVRLEKIAEHLLPTLTVSNAHPKVGDIITYTYKLCNTGSSNIDTISFTHFHDPGLTYISSNLSNYPNHLRATPLHKDSCLTFYVQMRVDSSIAFNTNVQSCFNITSGNVCPSNSVCIPIEVDATDISITLKQINCNTFRAIISNLGPVNATQVMFSYTTPACFSNPTATFVVNSGFIPGNNTFRIPQINAYNTAYSTAEIEFVFSSAISANCPISFNLLTLDQFDTYTPNNAATIIMGGYDSIATGGSKTICYGDSVQLGMLGISNATYAWYVYPNTTNVISVSPQPTVKPLSTTKYLLQMKIGTCNYTTVSCIVSVNALPTATALTPNKPTIVAGTTQTLSSTITGATNVVWNSSDTTIAKVNSSGVVTAINSGTAIITLNITNAAGCSKIVTDTVIVTGCTAPIVKPISGSHNICINDSTHLIDSTSGGIWSSNNTTIATVSSSGWVKAKAAGVDSIFYTVAIGGCTTRVAFFTAVRAKPTLYLSPITTQFCNNGDTVSLKATSNAIHPNYNWRTPYFGNYGSTDTVPRLIETITAVNNYKYYVTVTDSFSCSKSDSANLNVLTCYPQCNNAVSCTALTPTLSQGNYAESSKYCTENNVVVATGTTTFTNSEIVVNAGKSITVQSGATLKLYGCHLYSCDAMWQGIIVQPGATLIIDGTQVHSSFIEDAKIAVDVTIDKNYDGTYTGKPPIILSVNNTIFNRNDISITITGVGDVSNLSASFISIGNSMFTSRKLPFNGLNWSTVGEVKQNSAYVTNYPETVNSLESPYILDASYIDNNFGAYLKPPYTNGTTKPSIGIKLSNTNFNSGAITIGTPTGNTINYNTTLFDNLAVGINVINTTTNVNNCIFQKGWVNPNPNSTIPARPAQGYGVYASDCGAYQINITTANGNPRNAFYNMQYAVKTKDCNNVQVTNADIFSNQSIVNLVNTPTSYNGNWGIFVQGKYLTNINLSSNKITNVATGIKVDNTAGGIVSTVNVNNNIIRRNLPNTSASNNVNHFVLNAIALASVNTGTGAANVNSVFCNRDTLTEVFNGITVIGWIKRNISACNNIISLKKYTATTKQAGIEFSGCSGLPNTTTVTSIGNSINGNTITGDYFNSDINIESGVFVSATSNTNIGCNTVGKFNDGFKFNNGLMTGIQFWDNTIKISNHYGFTLDNQAQIGNIGKFDYVNNIYTCHSNNVWENGTTSQDWQNYSGGAHYRAYCAHNSDSRKSPLFVQTASAYNPEGATKGDGTPSAILYAAANNSIYTNAATGSCYRCTGLMAAKTEGSDDKYSLEEIALLNPDSANSNDEADIIWVNQQTLYDALQSDPALLDNNDNLQDFLQKNQYGTLDYDYLTGYALSTGNTNMAGALLNTWTTEGTQDYNNYTFYSWLYNMAMDANYQPPMDSLWTMANQCPLTNGKKVFAARNLYNTLTDGNAVFDEPCEGVGAMGRQMHPAKAPHKKIVYEEVTVYPNPTTGFVYINLPNAEKACWRITVSNVFGKRITEKEIRTNVGKTFVEIKGSKGMYFINILNCSTGKQEVKKLILE